MPINLDFNTNCGTATNPPPTFGMDVATTINFKNRSKSCAGYAKCGAACHHNYNLTSLKKYRKNGTLVKVYCKECDTVFDVDTKEKCDKEFEEMD